MFRFLLRGFLVVLVLAAFPAQAQIIDRIEVGRAGKDAEITIHFSTRIQYLRHGPLEPGKLLRVFVRLIDSDVPEADLMQQTMVSPETDLVPAFTVTFPELSNGMLVTFSRETSWQVSPGEDGRSIVIKVPALPGARDVMAEVRAPTETAAPSRAALPAPEPAVESSAPSSPAPVVAATEIAPTPAPRTEPAEAVVSSPPVAAASQEKAQLTPTSPAEKPALPEPAPATPTTPVAVLPPSPAATEVATGPVATQTVPAAPPPAMTATEVETMARGFLDEARQAVAEKDYARAINRLNRVLGLPSNSQTEPAQALIGEVRETTGEIAKARAEYELYLKVFPSGPAAGRVKEHLAALPKDTPRQARTRALPAEPGPAEWTYYGSVSQYLYKGNSHIEITTPPPPGQLDFTTDELSMTDQNALISTVDLNARRRDGVSDTRIVVRDTNTQNYLDRSRSTNRLYAAYVEQKNRRIGYLFRIGRQNPTGGGVLERFDGLNVGYDLNDRWRINGVAGIPVEFMSPYKKSFYGVSVDMQAQPGHVGFSTYFLQQYMDGVVNRQAVGIETRYFDTHAAVFGTFDYDLAFDELNIAMLQGNYRTDAGTNYFTYIDHRKTPPLGLTNAVAGMPGVSIKEALATLGLNQLRADAKALTATSDMLAIGVTHPFTPRWQLGTDYRYATISGTDAAGSMPAMPGSGSNHVISVQAIGNSLWTENDVAVVNGSYIKGATYNGQALGFNYVFVRGDTWRLDGNLRYYTQKDDSGERQKRWSPSLKVGYRWKLVTLEAEIGAEDVAIDGPTRIERSNRQYFFIGYRVDFR